MLHYCWTYLHSSSSRNEGITPFNAKHQASERVCLLLFVIFGLNRQAIETWSRVSVADALSSIHWTTDR